MKFLEKYHIDAPEVLLFLVMTILLTPLMVYMIATHVTDYRIMKRRYLKSGRWDLNISCGNTDGGGINADIVKRDVPNFVRVKDIYNLPFGDKQFKNTLCSHTIEHVEDPDRFFSELRRVSENVVLIIPPVWDMLALLDFREHKWQFLSMNPKQVNRLPRKFRLPYWGIQERFGQKIRC